jgi:hypothetical protein
MVGLALGVWADHSFLFLPSRSPRHAEIFAFLVARQRKAKQ